MNTRTVLSSAAVLALAASLGLPAHAGPRWPGNSQGEAAAQAPSPAPQGDLLRTAKTVYVSGEAGKQTANRDIWNPNASRAALKVEEVMREWGRYKVVLRLENADLLLVVSESHHDFGPDKPARLVAELKAYPGREQPTADTPILWADEAVESGSRQPSAKVADMFKEYVKKLEKR